MSPSPVASKTSAEKRTLAMQEKKRVKGILEIGVEVKKSNVVIDYKDIHNIEKIAQGGYGAIYKANWQGIPVVLKELLLPKKTIENENDFEHEVAIMLKLRHPNILTLYGIVLKPEFMVVELMNESL